MSRVRLTTDMGDWSTVPRRLRWAFASLVVGASLVGLAVAFGLITFPMGVVALSLGGIVLLAVFDRRRPWWPDEPSVPVDPIGRHATRDIVAFAIVGLGVGVLVALGILTV